MPRRRSCGCGLRSPEARRTDVRGMRKRARGPGTLMSKGCKKKDSRAASLPGAGCCFSLAGWGELGQEESARRGNFGYLGGRPRAHQHSAGQSGSAPLSLSYFLVAGDTAREDTAETSVCAPQPELRVWHVRRVYHLIDETPNRHRCGAAVGWVVGPSPNSEGVEPGFRAIRHG